MNEYLIEQVDKMRTRHAVIGSVDGDASLCLVRSPTKASISTGNAPTVEVVATTDGVDLDNEVVVPSGVDQDSYFFSNRSVFVDHRYDYDAYVGKARNWTPHPSKDDHRAWRVGIRHRPEGESVLSDDLLKVARRGEIGTSIGFEITEAGPPNEDELKRYGEVRRVIRGWKWLELSYTYMPCNVQAQALSSADFIDQRNAGLDDLVSKGQIHRSSAVALGLPTRKIFAVADSSKAKRKIMFLR